jgi:uncharacterized protein (DUF983 family)
MRTHCHQPAHMSPGPRPLFRSLARGFRGACPQCGKGALFRGYLKPAPVCLACMEDLTHQRADDAPPYFTMLIVGHLLVPLMLAAQFATDFPAAVHLAIWLPLTAVLTLALLRPVKGTLIAAQWALRMHGFDGNPDPDRFDRMLAGAVAKVDRQSR